MATRGKEATGSGSDHLAARIPRTAHTKPSVPFAPARWYDGIPKPG